MDLHRRLGNLLRKLTTNKHTQMKGKYLGPDFVMYVFISVELMFLFHDVPLGIRKYSQVRKSREAFKLHCT